MDVFSKNLVLPLSFNTRLEEATTYLVFIQPGIDHVFKSNVLAVLLMQARLGVKRDITAL